jgi:hypothetical protein
MQFLVNTAPVVPVVLTNATTGLPDLAAVFGGVSVLVIQPNGTTNSFVPASPEWTPRNTGAALGSGLYMLTIPAGNITQNGVVTYIVSYSADDTYIGNFDVVSAVAGDFIAAISASTATTAVNITNSQAVVTAAITTGTNTVTSAITAAQTSIKGAGNKDLTQVDTDVTNGNIATAATLATLTALAQRILALSYDNVVEDGQVYNGSGKLTASSVWFYNSAANATTNDHVTGLTYRYSITGAYDINGNCTLFGMTRVI